MKWMTRTATLLLGVGLLLGAPLAALARQPAPAPQAAPEASPSQPLTWADLDVDGNGNLSKQEASNVQSLAQAFDNADADKDGQLTPDEYRERSSRSMRGLK